MPIITLPVGTEKSFDQAVSVFEVAKSIGSGLAKATLAGKVNGELVDASFMIEVNSTLSIITDKDAEGLEVIEFYLIIDTLDFCVTSKNNKLIKLFNTPVLTIFYKVITVL
jgi:hypothetical protein